MTFRVECSIAVTGVNATDNPAPGVAVARALRHEPKFAGRVVGLGYDALDPGFYADGLLDGGAILPFPSAGRGVFFDRLRELKGVLGFDVLIPTLDSEMRAVSVLSEALRAERILTFVPTLDAIERSSKPRLAQLGEAAGIRVPESEAVVTSDALSKSARRLGLPMVVKGLYYGARVVHTDADAVSAFHHFSATWGVPVIVQRHVDGDEYNVAALGDGKGNLVGAVAMRKLALTDKGKGWAGVTVDNPALLAIAERVVGALRWKGPLEVEILAAKNGTDLFVIEINPRFPAWIYLAAGAGQNLPYACLGLALGMNVPSRLPPGRPGTMFVRISLDQIADLSTYSRLVASGIVTAPTEPA